MHRINFLNPSLLPSRFICLNFKQHRMIDVEKPSAPCVKEQGTFSQRCCNKKQNYIVMSEKCAIISSIISARYIFYFALIYNLPPTCSRLFFFVYLHVNLHVLLMIQLSSKVSFVVRVLTDFFPLKTIEIEI